MPGRLRLDNDRKLKIARIKGPHGVRGLVSVECYAHDARVLTSYSPLVDEMDNKYPLSIRHRSGRYWVGAIDSIMDRDTAQSLTSTTLYICRHQLPDLDDGEFYQADLIDLSVADHIYGVVGIVARVANHGAGDILEVAMEGQKQTMDIPFRQPWVGKVDVLAGIIWVELPLDWLQTHDRRKP